MALTPNSTPNVEASKSESVQLLASKLPEAQALPDGFSDSFTDPTPLGASVSNFSDQNTQSTDLSSVLLDASTGLIEVHADELGKGSSFFTDFPNLGFRSRQRADSPNVIVGFTEDFSVDLSSSMESCVSSDKTTEMLEKTRRFPVLLSAGDSSDSIEACISENESSGSLYCDFDKYPEGKEQDTESTAENGDRASSSSEVHLSAAGARLRAPINDEPLQEILESKIAELEIASTGQLKCEDDDSKLVRARKRQVREVRAILDGTERSSEEKLRLLNSKYLQQVAETRQLEKELLGLSRKCEQTNKEKDTIYAELTKNTALRQKLESLCRELQRQNKILLDENKWVTSKEEQKQQELSAKFQDTIKSITAKLQDQGDERSRQKEENEILREKLKHFTQQYDIREQHFAHQLQTKSLEQQLLDVKLKQQQDLVMQGDTKNRLYTEQLTQLLKTEQDLRSQLSLYGDKFEQFQETLTKSNEVFATFKEKMEKMSKTIKKLEKENLSLKKKCEKSDVTVIELFDERGLLKKQLESTKNQKEKLEALCRSLQAERKKQLNVAPSLSAVISQQVVEGSGHPGDEFSSKP